MDSQGHKASIDRQDDRKDLNEGHEDSTGKENTSKKESVVEGQASTKNRSVSARDNLLKDSIDNKITDAIFNHICLELTSSTASLDTTDTEFQDDFLNFIEEATAGVSSPLKAIGGTQEPNIIKKMPLVKTDLTPPETTALAESTHTTPSYPLHSINAVYDKCLKEMIINPFSGKMIPLSSKIATELFKIGFRQHPSNLLQLEWSPNIFVSQCYKTAKRLKINICETASKNPTRHHVGVADPTTMDSFRQELPFGAIPEKEGVLPGEDPECKPHMPRIMDQILTSMLKSFENTSIGWRMDLSRLMRRPDVLTAVGEELHRRYRDLVASYMPPKLDASPDPNVVELKLTPDQTNTLHLALRGYHLYIGGSAGTGKTMLLKAIFHRMREFGLRVAMTASTGVAAVQLGGCTFHHAFNVPIVSNNVVEGIHSWDMNALRAVDVVIIDEVSLLEARMFDTFDMEARIARMSSEPFGGMQVIVCGDFLQLSNDNLYDAFPIYMSETFKYLIQLKLVTPMRHSVGDPLLALLNQLRHGIFHKESFEALDRPIPPDAGEVTYIFPRRQYANKLNEEKLNELTTTEMSFIPQRGPLHLIGQFTPSVLIGFIPRNSSSFTLPSREEVVKILQEEITNAFSTIGPLCEHHCVVMPGRTTNPSILVRWRCSGGGDFMSNDGTKSSVKPQGWAGRLKENIFDVQLKERWGSIAQKLAERVEGKVLQIFKEEPTSLVPLSVSMTLADMTERTIADTLSPLRLKLGCRVMINRNLSQTVSNGSVGVVEAFMLPDISLFPHRTDVAACGYYRRLLNLNFFEKLPVVRLLNGEIVQIPPINTILGGTPASFYYGHEAFALPLQLGYGFTVHKVQGLTLQGTVVLDCKSFFDCPHLIYVACSRVRNINQLIVRNINEDMVIVKRKALQFSEGLSSADDARVLVVPPHIPRAVWTQQIKPQILYISN
ncbi:unnamed protein product [Phytomonas sp. Hart1]|nr:unnamed protein product [Phytomonas sp. Hart1]|eukprot:CCW68583.1 unnamed protein product [Phytomonas sp. isolate Hart1]